MDEYVWLNSIGNPWRTMQFPDNFQRVGLKIYIRLNKNTLFHAFTDIIQTSPSIKLKSKGNAKFLFVQDKGLTEIMGKWGFIVFMMALSAIS